MQLNQLTLSNLTFGLAFDFQTSPTLGVGMPSDPTKYPYNTYLQQLQSRGIINSLTYSLYLNDVYSTGEVFFGAIDETKFYGDLQAFDNFGDRGLDNRIPIEGVWWNHNNQTTNSLVKPNRGDDEYKANGTVSFGTTGTYVAFDFTNKQTLIAPAIQNATGSTVKEVGVNGAKIKGKGDSLPHFYNIIPPIVDINGGNPAQPASDPAQSKAIIAGGILGGILVLIFMLGAVYAIRPRSQRTRDFKTWFTFTTPRKPSQDPVIAYPPQHDSSYYPNGTTRHTPANYRPSEPRTPDQFSNGSLGDITPVSAPEPSYYVNTAFRPTRLSHVSEAVEMAPASQPISSLEYSQYQQQQPNRYGHAQ
ncbi:hypothetical protein ABW20_dc0100419 [Dactylellina cionopaga]|nr:hypothetical protein ABW20_dc0100419 [Dactylellina cionopaga]